MGRKKGKQVRDFEDISDSLKSYKVTAKRAVRELLCFKDEETIDIYINRITAATSSSEISRVMADVRKLL